MNWHEKYYMLKKDVLKFYKENKSYCSMPFKEIYDNAGRYKLCCHAKTIDWKYNTMNTTLLSFSSHLKWKK